MNNETPLKQEHLNYLLTLIKTRRQSEQRLAEAGTEPGCVHTYCDSILSELVHEIEYIKESEQ